MLSSNASALVLFWLLLDYLVIAYWKPTSLWRTTTAQRKRLL